MADYANALVRFKAKSKYCDAIEQVFNKRLKNYSKYYEWFDYFDMITEKGKLTKGYSSKEYYLNYKCGLGYNSNRFEEYSIPDIQGIKDGIVSLEMCQKWSDLNYMIPIVEYNLGVLAEEVYFCEIIAYDNNLEKYYLVSYDVVKDDKYHFRLIEKGRREIYED